MSAALADAYVQLNKLLCINGEQMVLVDSVLPANRLLTWMQDRAVDSLDAIAALVQPWLPHIRSRVLEVNPDVDLEVLTRRLQALHRAAEGYLYYSEGLDAHIIGVSWALTNVGQLGRELIVIHRQPDRTIRWAGYKRTWWKASRGEGVASPRLGAPAQQQHPQAQPLQLAPAQPQPLVVPPSRYSRPSSSAKKPAKLTGWQARALGMFLHPELGIILQCKGNEALSGSHGKAISAFLHTNNRDPRLERYDMIPQDRDSPNIEPGNPHPFEETRFLFSNHETANVLVDPDLLIAAARREPTKYSRRQIFQASRVSTSVIAAGIYDPVHTLSETPLTVPQPSRYRQEALIRIGEGLEQVARVFYSFRDCIPLCLVFQQLFC
jgi:hypothetical protein